MVVFFGRLVDRFRLAFPLAWLVFAVGGSRAGELIEDRPTFHCLSYRWTVASDAEANARVEVRYRKSGEQPWRRALDLFRTTANWKPDKTPKRGETLLAGSIVDLEQATEYEVRFDQIGPAGGSVSKVVRSTTRKEPSFEHPSRMLHVRPGNGGGSGTLADPFLGLQAAQPSARPGDLLLIHQGVYRAPFEISRHGQPGMPIVWRAAGDGEVVIDGGEVPSERGISASGSHDVWFEGISIRNVKWGLVCHESQRVVARRCRITGVEYGFTATRSSSTRPCLDLVVTDNEIVGPSTWPRTKGIENARGVQISGQGHVIAYNHIRGFADAIDTFDSAECSAIDIHGNEIEVMTDDGIECDYSQHNVRVFRNRLTNVFQGISTQPIFGGPVLVFRNVLQNVARETFKMHNAPSGAMLFHNTSVKLDMPLMLYTGEAVDNFITRNNLFIGGSAQYAFESTAPMNRCDFDFDGFGGAWSTFLKWNGKRYSTLEEAQRSAPAYRHAVVLDPITTFRGGDVRPLSIDLEIKPGAKSLSLGERSSAIDKGVPIPNINDGFRGEAPDLGAQEFADDSPHYGPRRQ